MRHFLSRLEEEKKGNRGRRAADGGSGPHVSHVSQAAKSTTTATEARATHGLASMCSPRHFGSVVINLQHQLHPGLLPEQLRGIELHSARGIEPRPTGPRKPRARASAPPSRAQALGWPSAPRGLPHAP